MAVGPLARLLSALSAECDDLGLRVEDLQRFLPGNSGGSTTGATGTAAAGHLQVDAMIAAQDIDYIQQHLDNLSQFLMLFAELTPADILVDLDAPLQSIRLANLKHRLAGTEPDTNPNTTQPGELELL